MKKTLIVFLSALALCACRKTVAITPEEPVEDPTLPKLTVLSATKADGCSWQDTDRIWLRSAKQKNGEKGTAFTVAANGLSKDGKTASFEGNTLSEGPYAAVSPYDAVESASDNSGAVFNVEAAQMYLSGSEPANYYAAAWAEGNVPSFRNMLGTVRLSIRGEGQVKSFIIRDMDDASVLWGRASVSFDGTKVGAVTISNEKSGSNELVINCVKPVTLDKDKATDVMFLAPQGAFASGIMVTSFGPDQTPLKTATVIRDMTVTLDKTAEVEMDFVNSAFSGGKGTVQEPYFIASAADLVELSELCNNPATNPQYFSAHYRQIRDIDMNGVEYTSICFDYDDDNGAFAGTYDGDGHKIVNLEIRVDADTRGLFGYIRGATVRNLTMQNCSVDALNRLGIIAGTAWKGALVENCKVIDCYVHSTTKDQLGGIIGYSNGSTIRNCETVNTKILADDHNSVGAICGFMKNKGVISNCSVSGCEILAWSFGGGILGRTVGGEVRNCVVKGKTKINTISKSAGGIGGGDDGTSDDLVIDNCLVTDGTVIKSLYYSGGIAGYIYAGEGLKVKIMNCGVEDSWILTQTEDGGDGTGDCCTGGIVGWLRNSYANSKFLVLNNYCYVADKGFEVDTDAKKPSIGGIAGYISNSSTSTLEIGGNCNDFARTDLVVAGKVFKEGQEIADSDYVGAIYGKCAADRATMSIRNNFWVNDTGFPKAGHGGLSKVIIKDNEGFTTAVFRDGSTVVARLNAYASSYSGEKLNTWVVKDNRPAFNYTF